MNRFNIAKRDLGLTALLWSSMLSVSMAEGTAENKSFADTTTDTTGPATDPHAAGSDTVVNNLANINQLNDNIANLTSQLDSMELMLYIAIIVAVLAFVAVVILFFFNKKEMGEVDEMMDGLQRQVIELKKGKEDLNREITRLEKIIKSNEYKSERQEYKSERHEESRYTRQVSSNASDVSCDSPSPTIVPATSTATSIKKPAPVFSNPDGLNEAEAGSVEALVRSYNDTYKNEPPTTQKNRFRNAFVNKFGLKGFSCANSEALTSGNVPVEFASTDNNPEFYGMQVQGNIYAVVPALWRTWPAVQIQMFGMKDIFNVRCQTDVNSFTKVYVSKEALFTLQGNKWILKRAGKADLSE